MRSCLPVGRFDSTICPRILFRRAAYSAAGAGASCTITGSGFAETIETPVVLLVTWARRALSTADRMTPWRTMKKITATTIAPKTTPKAAILGSYREGADATGAFGGASFTRTHVLPSSADDSDQRLSLRDPQLVQDGNRSRDRCPLSCVYGVVAAGRAVFVLLRALDRESWRYQTVVSLRHVGALVVIAGALLATGCASAPSAVSIAPVPSVVEYEVSGLLHVADGKANVCAVELQSYPPQCGGGIPLAGMDTVALPPDLVESARGVKWGYARLIGTYEDGILTLTRDPLPPLPLETPPLITTEPNVEELAKIAEAIASENRSDVITVGAGDVVEVLTALDADGTLQASFDSEFGPGAVVVTSWLQPVKE